MFPSTTEPQLTIPPRLSGDGRRPTRSISRNETTIMVMLANPIPTVARIALEADGVPEERMIVAT